mmetsp:Transcript_69333/g.124997  ORF Transcript_69333/g.124997 Transcript_69333/m.124997 type:complete len:229 (-) Transcript_69333:238-924(-)
MGNCQAFFLHLCCESAKRLKSAKMAEDCLTLEGRRHHLLRHLLTWICAALHALLEGTRADVCGGCERQEGPHKLRPGRCPSAGSCLCPHGHASRDLRAGTLPLCQRHLAAAAGPEKPGTTPRAPVAVQGLAAAFRRPREIDAEPQAQSGQLRTPPQAGSQGGQQPPASSTQQLPTSQQLGAARATAPTTGKLLLQRQPRVPLQRRQSALELQRMTSETRAQTTRTSGN